MKLFKPKHIIILLLGLLLACSNSDKKIKIPEGIIPPEEMAQIFRDIHLTDALLSRKRFRINTDFTDINSYYKDIYEKHGYSRAYFDSSLKFYTDHPYVLDAMYEQVLTELSIMVDTVSKSEYN